MFSINFDSLASKEWDEQLLKGKTDSVYLFHSTCWSERLVDLLNYTPVYVTVSKNSLVRLMMLGFIVPPPKMFNKTNLKTIIKNPLNIFGNGHKFIWYGQPVYFENGNDETDAYEFLAKILNDFLKAKRLPLSRGEWPIAYQSALPRDWKPKPWSTLKVDLTKDVDAIFAGFKSAARKEIRKAEKSGVIVKRIMSLEELEQYYQFASDCSKRYGKKLIGFKDFQTMWKYLRKWGYYETFVAHYSGKIVGGLSVWGDKYCLIEVGSFQSEESFKLKLGSSDAIKWEAVKWGKSVNAKSFDLAGVNPSPNNEKESNIKRFKEKWSESETKYLIVST